MKGKRLPKFCKNYRFDRITHRFRCPTFWHQVWIFCQLWQDFATVVFSNIKLQVETFGTMEKKEKVEFILEQMRLCFETKDYIRTQIISKKISTKYFEAEDTEELKLRYNFYFLSVSVPVVTCMCVY